VIRVEDLSSQEIIARELVLIKIGANAATRNDIMHVVNTFRAKIVDVSPDSLTIEVTGSEGKVDAMLELLRPFDLKEVVRTGQIAMARRGELKAPSKCGGKSVACKAVKKTKKK
jgi:acetolactate synthase-1/3 small subunit